ncbi:GH1 family beta-glucosidase [Acidocella sp.]|uniref:GH1 family beta-glucosidase n=3 Tax=Acidocella sp. TaxID=50710 RepID=UPI002637D888|nr:GH1 family beta-glucosidase [Acidocella sp.]
MKRRGLLAGAPVAGLAPGALSPDALIPRDYPAGVPAPGSFRFPPGFAFGVASSAYQIEGATREDGRGLGMWDVFCHTPGRTRGNADIAADHYHRMPEDVALMKAAGIRHYRFSVSWPRLFPDASFTPNPKGFAFYDRLLDELCAAGITPWMTLYHWDLPQWISAEGGWMNRDSASYMAEFAARAGAHFGDRVGHWMVMNEVAVQAILGYGIGVHAPGLVGREKSCAALHHMNLGQGYAIAALRAAGVRGRIGTVGSLEPVRPSSSAPEDVAAAAKFDALWNGAVLDPLFKGRYPALVEADFAPFVRAGDMAAIRQKVDFIGVNYYSRLHIQHTDKFDIGAIFGANPDPVKYRALRWPIEPDGLYEEVKYIHDQYGAPEIVITENGFATTTDPNPGNGLEDDGRLSYLAQNLAFLRKAADEGLNVKGYFVWALMDSFEWSEGTKWHFGLVRIEYPHLARTPRQSYYWYSDLIRAQGIEA